MAKQDIIYVNTVPSTLTLNFGYLDSKIFTGTAAFTGSKTVALTQDSAADGFILNVSVTTSAELTFPSSFVAETTESRWNSGTNVLTLTGTGTYSITAIYDGSNWKLKASADGGFA